MPVELTEDEKKRAEKLLELMASGDTSEEAQAKFDELMTPELHEKFGHAILAIGGEATPPRHAREEAPNEASESSQEELEEPDSGSDQER